jgi:hypothetical protein
MTAEQEALVAAVTRALEQRGVKREGDELKFQCFFPERHQHGDADWSASFNPVKAVWCCRVCGIGGGVLNLAERLGIERPQQTTTTETVYLICDADGVPLAEHVRIDHPTGEKVIFWRRPGGLKGLGDNLKAKQLPFYNLRALLAAAPDAVVIVTEGEKACDALTQRGLLAVGTVTGAATIPVDDVLRVLAGHPVVLWPDGDDPGRTHMRRIAACLMALDISVRWVEWKDAPPGGDAADWPHTTAELEALLGRAGAVPDTEEPRATGGQNKTASLPSQAARLVKLAARAELFHTPEKEPYATVVVAEHSETYPVRSKIFKMWLQRQFYEATKKIPNAQATADALNVLMGQALFDGPTLPVSVRLAPTSSGGIMLDLGAPDWTAIEVTAADWHLVTNPPVKFRRPRGLLALPIPVPGGRIDELRQFLNLGADENWYFVVAWLLGALRPAGPYPILGIHGEGGTAKTNVARILRSMIDPNTAPLRGPPRDDQNLVIAASNSWILGYDNLSKVPPWLSDALCRVATGGGFGTRELYADLEEILLDVQRPVVFTSIEDLGTRGDFADRKLGIYCPPIDENDRVTEAKLWAAVDAARPVILGALLTAVSMGLRRWDVVGDGPWPRMADFAQWVTACEPALGWKPGTLVRIYRAHRQESAATVIESSSVGRAVCKFMQAYPDRWEGTMEELLEALTASVSESIKKDKNRWPQSPRGLRGTLDRLAPDLRRLGWRIEFSRTTDARKVCIRPSSPSSPSWARSDRQDSRASASPRHDGRHDGRGGTPPEPSSDRHAESVAVSRGDDGHDGHDGRDGRDAEFSDSVPGERREPGEDDLVDDEEVLG